MTCLGGLALIYVARGRFFDSQSKAESSNTETFEGGLEYSLHSFPQPHTFAGLSARDPHDPPISVQNHMKSLNNNF